MIWSRKLGFVCFFISLTTNSHDLGQLIFSPHLLEKKKRILLTLLNICLFMKWNLWNTPFLIHRSAVRMQRKHEVPRLYRQKSQMYIWYWTGYQGLKHNCFKGYKTIGSKCKKMKKKKDVEELLLHFMKKSPFLLHFLSRMLNELFKREEKDVSAEASTVFYLSNNPAMTVKQ